VCGPPQYLVNVPEGYARLALEHRARPDGRLRAVLATGLAPSALVGGTPAARRPPSSLLCTVGLPAGACLYALLLYARQSRIGGKVGKGLGLRADSACAGAAAARAAPFQEAC